MHGLNMHCTDGCDSNEIPYRRLGWWQGWHGWVGRESYLIHCLMRTGCRAGLLPLGTKLVPKFYTCYARWLGRVPSEPASRVDLVAQICGRLSLAFPSVQIASVDSFVLQPPTGLSLVLRVDLPPADPDPVVGRSSSPGYNILGQWKLNNLQQGDDGC